MRSEEKTELQPITKKVTGGFVSITGSAATCAEQIISNVDTEKQQRDVGRLPE